MKDEAVKNSSLKYWNCHSISYNNCNQICLIAGSDTVSVQKTNIHIKFVYGVYTVQSKKAKYEINSLCPLCHAEDETIEHFLYTCNVIETLRGKCTSKLHDLLQVDSRDSLWNSYTSDERVQIVLDHSLVNGLSNRVREEIYKRAQRALIRSPECHCLYYILKA